MRPARRLTTTVVVLGALALLLAVVGVVVVAGSGGAPGPSSAAGVPPLPRDDPAQHRARPLVWAEGRALHLGARTVDTGEDLLSLDVTDDGVAFTTFDGVVWFTDGSRPQQVGATLPARAVPAGIDWGPLGPPDLWVVSAGSGSLLAWLEATSSTRLEAVVYDTRLQRVVAHVPVHTGSGRGGQAEVPTLLSVGADRLYWTDAPVPPGSPAPEPGTTAQVRGHQISTGREWREPVADYLAELRHRPRMLLLGPSPARAVLSDGVGQSFAFVGTRLVPRRGDWTQAWNAADGAPLRLQAPAGRGYGYGVAERLELVEWLDDDRFVLLDSTGWNAGVHGGEDLLVCRLSSGRCRVAVDRPVTARRLVVPEYTTPGSDMAATRAAAAARADGTAHR